MGNRELRLDVPDDLVDVGLRVHLPAVGVCLAEPGRDLGGDEVALKLLQKNIRNDFRSLTPEKN